MDPGLLPSVTTPLPPGPPFLPAGGCPTSPTGHTPPSLQANKCIYAFACAVPCAWNACPFLCSAQLALPSGLCQASCPGSHLKCVKPLDAFPSCHLPHGSCCLRPAPRWAGPQLVQHCVYSIALGGREKPGPRLANRSRQVCGCVQPREAGEGCAPCSQPGGCPVFA